ncbi:MAG TPA: hypothetical protein VF026_32035 [Ktedonobacteraceae bacterium]
MSALIPLVSFAITSARRSVPLVGRSIVLPSSVDLGGLGMRLHPVSAAPLDGDVLSPAGAEPLTA